MNKDILILLIGRVSQLVYSFLNIKLLTNLLDTEQIGHYYLLLSIMSFFSMFLISPTGIYFTKNTNKWLDMNIYKPIMILFLYLIFIAVVFIPFVWVYINFSSLSLNGFLLVIIVFLDIVFGTLLGTLLGVFNMIFKRTKFVIYTSLYLYFGLGLSILFYFLDFKSAEYWILGLMISKLFFFILVFFDFHGHFKQNISLELIKNGIHKTNFTEIKLFLLPLYLMTFLAWGQNNLYRFLVEDKFGPETLAIIAFGLSLVLNLSISFETIINQYFLPNYYKVMNCASKFKKIYYFNNMINYIIPAYIIFYLFIIIISDNLIQLFANDKYIEAKVFIYFGVGIEFFRVISGLMTQMFYVENKTKQLLNMTLLSTISMLLFLLIAIYIFENIFLIGLSLFLGSSLLSILIIKNSKKITLFRFDLNILKFIFVLIFIIGFLKFLMSYFCINFIFILIILGLVYLFGMYLYVRNSKYAKI